MIKYKKHAPTRPVAIERPTIRTAVQNGGLMFKSADPFPTFRSLRKPN
ncbi:MAG: hypothetical protein ACJAYU_002361 [Bradymonadia bacterium]|jgi:hypothetical protein